MRTRERGMKDDDDGKGQHRSLLSLWLGNVMNFRILRKKHLGRDEIGVK